MAAAAGRHVSSILPIIAPVFGLVLLGWAAARWGGFDPPATRGLSLFVFNFAIPVMLARTLGQASLPSHPDWALLATYFGSAFTVFGVAAFGARHLFGRSGAEPAIFGITASFSNLVILGIPLVLEALGPVSAVPLFLLVAFHSALLFTLTTLVAEAGASEAVALSQLPLVAGRSLLKNPIFLGLVAGLVLNLAGVTLPPVLDRLAAYLAAASLPCALFALGANLARFRLAASLGSALYLALLKNLVQPLLVFVLGTWVFALTPLAMKVALVVAAGPAGINAYLFAVRYDAAVAEASSTVLLSTALSVLGLSLALAVARGG